MNSLSSASLIYVGAFLAYAQSIPNSSGDNIQQASDRALRGLPSIEVVHLEMDTIKSSTVGTVSSEELAEQIEAILKRYHVPLEFVPSKTVASFRLKQGIGSLITIPSYAVETEADKTISTTLTLRLQLEEPATLKRDPTHEVSAIMWSEDIKVDAPQVDSRKKVLDAISALAAKFSLAYLSANRKQ